MSKTQNENPSPAVATPPPRKVITPTVGRVVWYWRDPAGQKTVDDQPEAAIVVKVHSDTMVNLRVFDHDGGACGVKDVVLRQPDDGVPACSFCEWMPYQVGQAARTEAAENQLAKVTK